LRRRWRACDPALLLLFEEGDGLGEGGHLALEGCKVAPVLGGEPPGLLGLGPDLPTGRAADSIVQEAEEVRHP